MAATSDLVAAARDHAGDSLRVVATYEGDDIEFHYLRDDVAADYSDAEFDRIREHVFLEGIQEPHLEELFGGRDLLCQSFVFEDIVAFYYNEDDTTGRFVSADRGAFDELDAFVADCLSPE